MEKVTILILMSNPKGTDTLDLEKELSKILEALNESSENLKFRVVSCYAASTSSLQKEFRKYKPQIVHFSGHGAGEKGLVFEGEKKNLQLASTKALAGLFELFKKDVECVVINACNSQAQVDEIYQHINCVIGMRQAIGDNAAIEFARGFYESLSAGESFERAYECGRNAIAFVSTSESETPIWRIKERDAVPTPKLISEPELKIKTEPGSLGQGGINAAFEMRDNHGAIIVGEKNNCSMNHNS